MKNKYLIIKTKPFNNGELVVQKNVSGKSKKEISLMSSAYELLAPLETHSHSILETKEDLNEIDKLCLLKF